MEPNPVWNQPTEWYKYNKVEKPLDRICQWSLFPSFNFLNLNFRTNNFVECTKLINMGIHSPDHIKEIQY